MFSNTKLTAGQKLTLKLFKKQMPKNMAFGHWGRVTVLIQITGNVIKFSTSVASPYEKKLRKKVGEWYALERWNMKQYAVLPNYDGNGLTKESMAQSLAHLVS